MNLISKPGKIYKGRILLNKTQNRIKNANAFQVPLVFEAT